MTSRSAPRERTRAIARVIGPCLTIEACVIIARAPAMGDYATSFYKVPALVWFTGSMMLFGGVAIIAFHQYWRGLSAILISLFGWFIALRGLALLAVPDWYAAATSQASSVSVVRLIFALPLVIGVRLTYTGWIARTTSPGD